MRCEKGCIDHRGLIGILQFPIKDAQRRFGEIDKRCQNLGHLTNDKIDRGRVNKPKLDIYPSMLACLDGLDTDVRALVTEGLRLDKSEADQTQGS